MRIRANEVADRSGRELIDSGTALPYPWNWDFANLFPSTAAQQITSVDVSPASHAFQAGPSYALLAAYAIGVPCLAAWLLRRRDA